MTRITHTLEVWGDFACFSRPELKVERFSYPCPTPSAARGIFDAIYVKPTEFRWQIVSIELLTFPTYIALRRFEVKEKISTYTVSTWMTRRTVPEPLWADREPAPRGSDEKGRTLRQTMALRDVRYRLHAQIRPWASAANRQAAYDAQFRRRAAQGKCLYQPYLGCREFAAFFTLVTEPSAPPRPVPVTMDLGYMLYDVFDLSKPGRPTDTAAISLFDARIRSGTLDVPEFDSIDVLKAADASC